MIEGMGGPRLERSEPIERAPAESVPGIQQRKRTWDRGPLPVPSSRALLSGDLRPWSLPNLFALVQDNRAERAQVRHVRSVRDRLIVETAEARRRLRRRIERRARGH